MEIEPESLARFSGSAEIVEISPEREVPPGARLGAQVSVEEETPSSSGDGGAKKPRVPPSERDRPNSPRHRRELRARAGGRCENPHCRRATRGSGHGHHIRPLSEGGATVLWNGIHVCARCHSLLHAGVLVVEGNPVEGLRWRARAEDLRARVLQELERARALPDVRTVAGADSGCPDWARRAFDSGCPDSTSGTDDSGCPERTPEGREVEDAISALVKLGFREAEARKRTRAAWARLGGKDDLKAARLVTEALRG